MLNSCKGLSSDCGLVVKTCGVWTAVALWSRRVEFGLRWPYGQDVWSFGVQRIIRGKNQLVKDLEKIFVADCDSG